jgi:multidrug efflux pump subunit AcrA (membrane-fusion protein)
MLTENDDLPGPDDRAGSTLDPYVATDGPATAVPTEERARDLVSLLPASVRTGGLRRQRRRQRVVLALVGVAVLVAAGLVVARSSDASTLRYRTATVTTRAVSAALHGVATIEPVQQAAVAFPVSGTVTGVDVVPGATVAAGQQLATIDTTQLVATLHEKEAALAQAQLALSKALDGQATVLPSSNATRQALVAADPSSTRADAVFLAAVTPTPDAKLAAAQQAVLKAQQAVDAALTDAATALTSAQAVCAAAGVGGGSGTTPTPGQLTACQTALAAVQAAQAGVSQAQSDLADAAQALDDLLQQMATTPPPTTVPPTTGPPTTAPPTSGPPTSGPPTSGPPTAGSGGSTHGSRPGSGSTPPSSSTSIAIGTGAPGRTGSARPRTGSFSGGGGGSSGGGAGTGSATGGSPTSPSPTAADLAAYQSAVDVAALDVTVAQQAIAQASVVSPIKGTVLAVNMAKGDAVTASSTTETIVIKGQGGYDASTTVSLDDIRSVKVGQAASVLADGSAAPVNGKVVSIASVPRSGTTTTSFAVAISLTGNSSTLGNGAIGSATIVTGSTAAALSVPTSAVTTTGALHTVTVLDGDATQQVPVQVGVTGSAWTAITRGLSAGQQVVLADLDQPLPSSATASTNAGTNAQGRFTGFSGFGGGLAGLASNRGITGSGAKG